MYHIFGITGQKKSPLRKHFLQLVPSSFLSAHQRRIVIKRGILYTFNTYFDRNTGLTINQAKNTNSIPEKKDT